MQKLYRENEIVYLYRVLEDACDSERYSFGIYNGKRKNEEQRRRFDRDEGRIYKTPGVAEVEITATSILSKGDTMIGKLEAALDSDKLIEVWEVNLDEEGTSDNVDKFKAKYSKGILRRWRLLQMRKIS